MSALLMQQCSTCQSTPVLNWTSYKFSALTAGLLFALYIQVFIFPKLKSTDHLPQ